LKKSLDKYILIYYIAQRFSQTIKLDLLVNFGLQKLDQNFREPNKILLNFIPKDTFEIMGNFILVEEHILTEIIETRTKKI